VYVLRRYTVAALSLATTFVCCLSCAVCAAICVYCFDFVCGSNALFSVRLPFLFYNTTDQTATVLNCVSIARRAHRRWTIAAKDQKVCPGGGRVGPYSRRTRPITPSSSTVSRLPSAVLDVLNLKVGLMGAHRRLMSPMGAQHCRLMGLIGPRLIGLMGAHCRLRGPMGPRPIGLMGAHCHLVTRVAVTQTRARGVQ